MKGLVNIDVRGTVLNKHEVMWVQEYPNGDRAIILANMAFGEKIMEDMAARHREELERRATELMDEARGTQGL